MWKNILSKITNTKVIISIASTIVLIFINLGIEINSERIEVIVEGICTIGILLGVFNNSGMNTISWNDRAIRKTKDTLE